MNKAKTLLLFAVALTFAGESSSQVVYGTQHELLVKTIKDGHAEGVMAGDLAKKFTQQFRSTGVLLAKATVIKDFASKDCKRLQVVYTKKEIITPTGPRDLDMTMKLNYCLDGRPPASGEGAK